MGDVRLTNLYSEALTAADGDIRLTNLRVEVLSDSITPVTPNDVRATNLYTEALTQNASADVLLTNLRVEVLFLAAPPLPDPLPPGIYVTVNGFPWRVRADSMSIDATVNGRDTLVATFMVFPGETLFPAIIDELRVWYFGTLIFGGVIESVTEKQMSSDREAGIFCDVNAIDYNAIGDWRVTHGGVPGPYTLKEYLELLVPFMVGPVTAITLAPDQVDGPDLPDLTWDVKTISEVLDELTNITGFIHNVDYNGVLKMWEVDTAIAPYDIDVDNALGDVEVDTTFRGYANSVIVRAGETQQLDIVDTFVGDGVTTTFLLAGGVITDSGYVSVNGVHESIPGTWNFGTPVNTIVRSSPPAAGAIIEFPYFAQYPLIIIARDAALIAGADNGAIIEEVFTEPKITDYNQAKALAYGHLREVSVKRQIARFTVDGVALAPGQKFNNITIPTRRLSGPFFITDITTRMISATWFHQIVTAQTPLIYTGSWRDLYKQWGKVK